MQGSRESGEQESKSGSEKVRLDDLKRIILPAIRRTTSGPKELNRLCGVYRDPQMLIPLMEESPVFSDPDRKELGALLKGGSTEAKDRTGLSLRQLTGVVAFLLEKGIPREKQITVRRATVDDVPQIHNMLRLAFKDQFGWTDVNEELLQGKTRNPSNYYLGFVGDELAGMCAMFPRQDVSWISPISQQGVESQINVAYISDGFTHSQFRKMGVLSTIQEHILRDARDQGVTEVYESPESPFMLKSKLRRGFSLLGACVTCKEGPQCGGSIVRKKIGS